MRASRKGKLGILVPYSTQYGLGHFYRNQHFVDQFPDAIFLTDKLGNEENSIQEITIDDRFEIELIKREVGVLLIDHYFLDDEQLLALRSLSEVVTIYFDPNLKTNSFDAVISTNPFSKNNPDLTCKQFVGAEFFGFSKTVSKFKNGLAKEKDQVFICIGGSDPKELTGKILEAIDKSEMKIKAILGPAVEISYRERLVEKFNTYPNIELLHSPNNFHELLSKSQFAILSCSTVTYEAILLETPFVAIQYAQNQEELKRYYISNGVKVVPQEEIRRYFSDSKFIQETKNPRVQFSTKLAELYEYISLNLERIDNKQEIG